MKACRRWMASTTTNSQAVNVCPWTLRMARSSFSRRFLVGITTQAAGTGLRISACWGSATSRQLARLNTGELHRLRMVRSAA